MKKIIGVIFLVILFFAIAFSLYFFVGSAPKQNITFGVDFSQMQTESLKLDWKKTYLAILEDLGAKNIKLHTQWDWVEGKKDDFYFDDIDWQIKQAENHNAKIVYVVGMKTGRWPECHIPDWANSLTPDQEKNALLAYIQEVVSRYKNSNAIIAWQVENEPLFKFGECPDWYYQNDNFLKTEVSLVKSLDPSREVIVSNTGEYSLWTKVAGIGDVVGVTTYKNVWVTINGSLGFYFRYFLPPVFYFKRAEIIKAVFGKDVIGVELQAEPWTQQSYYNVSLQEQEKTMNLQQFKENVSYAEQTGFNRFYFWGVEWWYWLKETQNKPEIWNEAKTLFNN